MHLYLKYVCFSMEIYLQALMLEFCNSFFHSNINNIPVGNKSNRSSCSLCYCTRTNFIIYFPQFTANFFTRITQLHKRNGLRHNVFNNVFNKIHEEIVQRPKFADLLIERMDTAGILIAAFEPVIDRKLPHYTYILLFTY